MLFGAGDGNRTRVAGLGSRNSAIEPHPLIPSDAFYSITNSRFFAILIFKKQTLIVLVLQMRLIVPYRCHSFFVYVVDRMLHFFEYQFFVLRE